MKVNDSSVVFVRDIPFYTLFVRSLADIGDSYEVLTRTGDTRHDFDIRTFNHRDTQVRRRRDQKNSATRRLGHGPPDLEDWSRSRWRLCAYPSSKLEPPPRPPK
jgi:hypothetical protein